MLNDNYDYNYKINLKNKIYKKIINKFIKINNSLDLLNKYNNNINNQIGGGKYADNLRSIIDESKKTGEQLASQIDEKIQSNQEENINTANIESEISEKKIIIQNFLQKNIKTINDNLGKLKKQTGLLQTQLRNLEDLKLNPTEITDPLKTNVERYLQATQSQSKEAAQNARQILRVDSKQSTPGLKPLNQTDELTRQRPLFSKSSANKLVTPTPPPTSDIVLKDLDPGDIRLNLTGSPSQSPRAQTPREQTSRGQTSRSGNP